MATTPYFDVKIGARWFATDLAMFERAPLKSISQTFDTSREPGEQSLGNEGIWKRSQFDFIHGAGQLAFDDDEENDRRRFFWSIGCDPWTRGEISALPLSSNVYTITDGNLSGECEMVIKGGHLYVVAGKTSGDVEGARSANGTTWTGPLTGATVASGGFSLVTVGGSVYMSSDEVIQSATTTAFSAFGGLAPDYLIVAADRMLGLEGNTIYEIDGSGDLFGKSAGVDVATDTTAEDFTLVAHGLSDDDAIRFESSANGLQTYTTYYVVNATADDFQVSLSVGGSVVNLTGAELTATYYPWTPIYEHFESDYDFKGGVYSPAGVYVFGDDGTLSTVSLLVPVDSTTEFAPPYPVMELPPGELVRDMKFYGGVIVLATSLGFRLCQIGANGTLIYGPLREIGDVKCLEVQKQYCWFGWSQMNNDYFGLNKTTGLGRMGLDRFTDPLVPTYASDLFTANLGTSEKTVACAWFDGQMYYAVWDGGSNMRIWTEHATSKVATMSFSPGDITYGIPEQKAITSLEARHSALGASQTSGCAIWTDDATYTALTTIGADGTTRARFTTSIEAEKIVPVFTGVTDGDAMTYYRWTLRALPMVRRSERIRLGVMLYATISDLGYQQVRMDPQEQFEYLLSLMNGRTLTTLTMGDRSDSVMVDAVMIDQNQGQDLIQDWDDTGFINATWIVEMLTNADS